MKTKSTKQPKQTKPALQLKDLAAKKNPKAAAGRGPKEGVDLQHNETLVSDEQD